MSRSSKFLVMLVILGAMFLEVLGSAMENSSEETLEKRLSDFKNIKNNSEIINENKIESEFEKGNNSEILRNSKAEEVIKQKIKGNEKSQGLEEYRKSYGNKNLRESEYEELEKKGKNSEFVKNLEAEEIIKQNTYETEKSEGLEEDRKSDGNKNLRGSECEELEKRSSEFKNIINNCDEIKDDRNESEILRNPRAAKKIKEKINRTEESKGLEEERKSYVNRNLRENEYEGFVSYWVEKWGINLGYFIKNNKLTDLKDIKEYIENILTKFKKYRCEFKEDGEDEEYNIYGELVNKDEFFDFNKLNKAIEYENKFLAKEKNVQINKELVIKYIDNVLKYNKLLRIKTKTYEDLIRDAYEYAMKDLKKEYEEMQFIMKMREILEKIKQKDKKETEEACRNFITEISRKYREKNEKDFLEDFNELEYIFKKNMEDQEKIYFERFIYSLSLVLYSGIIEQYIDEIMELTKKQYKPRRFIEDIKKCIQEKFLIFNTVLNIKNLIGNILNKPTQENKAELFKLLRDMVGDELFSKIEKNLSDDIEKIKSKKSMGESVYFEDAIYINTIRNISYMRVLIFSDRLKEIIEGDFKEEKKIKNIKSILKDIEELKNSKEDSLVKEKVEKLIKELKDKMDDESIKKLRYLVGEKFFECYVEAVMNLIDNIPINFYDDFKKIIDKQYREKTLPDDLTKNLNDILIALDNKTSNEELKLRLNNLIEKVKSFDDEEINNKLEYLVKNLLPQQLRMFIFNVKEKIKNETDIADIFYYIGDLVTKEYDFLECRKKINELREKIEHMIDELEEKEQKDSEYKGSEEYDKFIEELRKTCEELYLKENRCGPYFLRLNISLVKDMSTNRYKINKMPVMQYHNDENEKTI